MANMEFWGLEVKGTPCKVDLDRGNIVHLSQATLGELKKDSEPVMLYVKILDKKHVLGVLSQSTPQLSFDLMFDQSFEISHTSKNVSVHFLGYQSEMDMDINSDFSESDDELDAIAMGAPKPAALAPKSAAAKPKALGVKPEEDDVSEDEDDSDDDEMDSDEDMSDMSGSDASGDDEGDEDDDEEDEKPAQVANGKKRPNGDAKTPESKKAKLATPQKTDAEKGPHSATPHPAKKGGKTPGATPKSGEVTCGSCPKTFKSPAALDSHSKAKHSAK